VHDTAHETQSLGGIRSIVADILLGRSGILSNPLFEVRGTREDIRGMPLFRDLNDNCTLQLLSREFGICARIFSRGGR